MKKSKIVAIFAMLACGVWGVISAQAARVEIGAGEATYNTIGNGIWYQDGFEHTLNLKSRTFLIGLRGELTSSITWHADYVNLGRASVDSWDTPVDANYNVSTENHCNGKCLPLVHVLGSGTVQGLALTLEPHTTRRGLRFGIEAGPFLFFPTWNMTVPNWQAATGAATNVQWEASGGGLYSNSDYRPQIGAVIGVSVERGVWGLRYRHYFDKTNGGTFPAIWKSTDTLMVTYQF